MTSFSKYPAEIDGYSSLPLVRDGIDEIRADDVNRLRDAAVKLEQELGTNPSGTFATVKDRLDDVGDTKSTVDGHINNATDAHDASAISVLDTVDNFVASDVEAILAELAGLIPPPPDAIGVNTAVIPNSGLPTFTDGYGTKSLYNTSSWVSDTDTPQNRTQPRASAGVSGVHIFDISSATSNGVATLTYTKSTMSLQWQDPSDSNPGTAVDISGLANGEYTTIYSLDTTKAIRIARTSDSLPIIDAADQFEVYSPEFVSGSYSVIGTGFQATNNITRTSISSTGASRSQFMISGMIYPADRGTLVLQRKRKVDVLFFPIAVLDLGDSFAESTRATSQSVYAPSMSAFDTVTLYDRFPISADYSETLDADDNQIYSNYTRDFGNQQVAKYRIPVSNSNLVGGVLESPGDATLEESNNKVSSYRVVHYKPDQTNFSGNPDAGNIYSLSDSLGSADSGDNNVRMSNVYVDSNQTRPHIEEIYIIPSEAQGITTKTISGIHYYNAHEDLFDFRMINGDDVFNNTYVRANTLRFTTNVLTFESGTTDGYWGNTVDLDELLDDTYVKYSAINLPTHSDKANYIVNSSINNGRQAHPMTNVFTTRVRLSGQLFDSFGGGDISDAYGDVYATQLRTRILINSYNSRANATQEYFTDEDFRVGEDEEFLFNTDANQFTFDDGYTDDGYWLDEWHSNMSIGPESLQCGGRFTEFEQDIPGLIYPQDNYIAGNIMPFQGNESYDGMTYAASSQFPDGVTIPSGTHIPSYDGYEDGDKHYNRLFTPGFTTSSAKLRVVSGGDNQLAFSDILYRNTDRPCKIEVKIPGRPGTDLMSTEWMDIGEPYSIYEIDLDAPAVSGAQIGEVTGTTGDFIVPFTFGYRNNNSAGDMIAVRVTYFGATAGERVESKKIIITMLELLR